ncbi:MAG: hypothetical protein KGM47_00085, partial [Acidobacteriota bacterium]|nr:hypothetical protein [Acidobacteriota bacterium]
MTFSRTRAGRIATAIELAAVYACILLYIWRWHRPHPLLWIPILAFIIFTHILHGDTLREMGITLHRVRASAKIIFPLAAVIYGAAIIWALSAHCLALPWPHGAASSRVGVYIIWCCFQQYLMQSYFYRRL